MHSFQSRLQFKHRHSIVMTHHIHVGSRPSVGKLKETSFVLIVAVLHATWASATQAKCCPQASAALASASQANYDDMTPRAKPSEKYLRGEVPASRPAPEADGYPKRTRRSSKNQTEEVSRGLDVRS